MVRYATQQPNCRTKPSLKPSGVPWLGDIPAGWDFPRIHSLFSEVNDRYVPAEDGELPLLSVSEYFGVAPRADKIGEDEILVRAESLDGYKKCRKGDIVVNIMLAWKNALGVSPCSGIVSPSYCVYRPRKEMDVRYFHHLFRTKRYGDVFRSVSTGIIDSRLRLYTDKFFSIHAPFPPLPEQRAIADFLDEKCAAIDAIVEEAKAGIEEYAKWKQSVVFQAVTKGLDPHAKMKDSGVEWIGEIPEEWKVEKLRFFGMLKNGISKGGDFFGEGSPFVSYSDVFKNDWLPETVDGLVLSSPEEQDEYSVRRGDVFFTRTSETIDDIGKAAVCLHSIPHATFAGFLIRVRPQTEKMSVDFSKYYFRNVGFQSFFSRQLTLVTRASLSQNLLKNLAILLPPLPEQRAIADYLDEKCSAIDALIEEKKQLIEDLDAYKKSLIYETVTGKRRVAG